MNMTTALETSSLGTVTISSKLSFPNPDHPNIEEIESVDPLEFIEMCLSCFCGKTGESDFEVMDNLIFMKAIE